MNGSGRTGWFLPVRQTAHRKRKVRNMWTVWRVSDHIELDEEGLNLVLSKRVVCSGLSENVGFLVYSLVLV